MDISGSLDRDFPIAQGYSAGTSIASQGLWVRFPAGPVSQITFLNSGDSTSFELIFSYIYALLKDSYKCL